MLLGLAWLDMAWSLLGIPPYVYVAGLFYNNVPRIEVPVRLRTNEPFAFRVRILEKQNYWLNLTVHFDGDAAQSAARAFIGGFHSEPGHLARPPGMLTA